MTRRTVVFVGSECLELPVLNRVVQEFDWALEVVADFDQLRGAVTIRRPAVILLDAAILDLGWRETLRIARAIDSKALLITCHRFSEMPNWSALAEAGAFHSLALPFHPGEVRQSLGFAWCTQFRRGTNKSPRNESRPTLVAKQRRVVPSPWHEPKADGLVGSSVLTPT